MTPKGIREILESRSNFILWFLLLTTFLAGCFFSYYQGDLLRFNDEKQYLTIAGNLSASNSFSLDGENLTSYRPPGYPFIISVLLRLGGGILSLRIFNYIFLCLSIFLIHKILKKYSLAAASLGVIFTFCYPVLFYTASTLYPQTIASTLFLLVIYIYDHQKMSFKNKSWLIGFIMGALILIIPTFIFATAIICAWVVFAHRKVAFPALLRIAFALFILIFPWTYRNYVVQGDWFFVSTNGGINLWLGNNAKTRPGIGADIKQDKHPRYQASDLEKSRFYQNLALEYMYENKEATVKMYFAKYLDYFSYWNKFKSKSIDSDVKKYIMMLTYGFLLISLMIRLALLKKYPLDYLDLLLIIIYFSNGAFTSIFFNRIRFRIPYDLLLILVNAKFYSQVLMKSYVSPYFELKKKGWAGTLAERNDSTEK